MPRDPKAKVTPEEIVGSILDEMHESITPGWYTDFVPNIFRVYLYREISSAWSASNRAFANRLNEPSTKNSTNSTAPLVPCHSFPELHRNVASRSDIGPSSFTRMATRTPPPIASS